MTATCGLCLRYVNYAGGSCVYVSFALRQVFQPIFGLIACSNAVFSHPLDILLFPEKVITVML